MSRAFVPASLALQRLDARWFQILFLASFLCLGALARDFALTIEQIFATFFVAICTQSAWVYALKLPQKSRFKHAFDAFFSTHLSAIISSFGICILVRSDNLWVHPMLAWLAISSKFLIRMGSGAVRSHVVNPANFAAFAALAWLPGAWLSPGQWGSESLVALWFLALGGAVTRRIGRLDISLTFLFTWGVLLAARLMWLDYSWTPGAAMWLQQISNGAVLLFAFFMISDPMTTPQQSGARIAYAITVAVLAFCWQFALYKPHGLIVMLFLMSWTVPLINQVFPKQRFEWRDATGVHRRASA